MEQQQMVEGILHLAQHFVRTIKAEQHIDVEYDSEAAHALSHFIDQFRHQYTDDVPPEMVQTMGAFLGECIRAVYGGGWGQESDTGEWGVAIPVRGGDVWTFPFSKVYKHFAQGSSESVGEFFDALRYLTNPDYNWSPE